MYLSVPSKAKTCKASRNFFLHLPVGDSSVSLYCVKNCIIITIWGDHHYIGLYTTKCESCTESEIYI